MTPGLENILWNPELNAQPFHVSLIFYKLPWKMNGKAPGTMKYEEYGCLNKAGTMKIPVDMPLWKGEKSYRDPIQMMRHRQLMGDEVVLMREPPNWLSNIKQLPIKCVHMNNTKCTWQVVLIYLFIYTLNSNN